MILSPLRDAARRIGRLRRTSTQPTVYLAAKYARREELQGLATQLEGLGYTVTSRWVTEPNSVLLNEELDPGRRGEVMASADLQDISRAAICIAFTEAPETDARGRGGRHVELGVAIGQNKKVIVVGPREHVFHSLASIDHHDSWETALEALRAPVAPHRTKPVAAARAPRELAGA